MANTALGIVIGFIFISLVVLFCVLLVKLYINKIKTYNNLIYQKDIDFQKTLNTSIIETQEQVLTNISQDLHDDAGQQLTYINFQIENLKLDSPDLQQALAPISDSIGQLSNSIRRISHSLNNQFLMQQDLLKAIRMETERLQQNGKIEIRLDIDQSPARTFEIDVQVVIYRIFQEIINNILKHSHANRIEISIATNPLFRMSVRDNGKGFDAGSVNKITLGLQNMTKRAEMIDYEIAIESHPGKGTTVNVAEKN